ncbi:hypothetical protein [Streptosporangium sp. NBC_01756]|uniref:hypothetical protein n=1 Tax=Streptosporangium sp. NBC_01756 TaxID=2975950 RepID=UPI002DDA5DA4|nr:hypothetical protein [Streptosporangium sp. NBC_01756]WSC85614.1 hypothetical protein OIE48_35460 [Streptosporangium sp. NBC_01756]
MNPEGQPEERTEKGKPMVRATPRDVVHIRLASFGLIPVVILGVFGFATGLTWLIVGMAVLAVILIAFIALAVRRESHNPDTTTEEAG